MVVHHLYLLTHTAYKPLYEIIYFFTLWFVGLYYNLSLHVQAYWSDLQQTRGYWIVQIS